MLTRRCVCSRSCISGPGVFFEPGTVPDSMKLFAQTSAIFLHFLSRNSMSVATCVRQPSPLQWAAEWTCRESDPRMAFIRRFPRTWQARERRKAVRGLPVAASAASYPGRAPQLTPAER